MKDKYKINLFMFGELNLNKTTAPTNPNTNSGRRDYDDLTPQMRAYYTADLIDLADPSLVYSQFAEKQPIPANNGKSIEWHGFADLNEDIETLTLEEGVTPDGLSLKQFDITGHVQQYGAYISFTDMLLMTGADKNISAANKKLAAQMSLLYDKIDRNCVMGGTHVIYAGNKSDRSQLTVNDKFTVDLIYEAVNELERRNAPKINGAYACVLHPDVVKDLLLSDEWKEMNKYSRPERFDAGYIGEINNCRFYVSTNAKIWNSKDAGTTSGEDGAVAGSGTAVYGCVFLASGAFGTTEITGGGVEVIVKQLGSGGTADPLNQRASVGVRGTKGSVILINDYIIRVECGSSRGLKTTESN